MKQLSNGVIIAGLCLIVLSVHFTDSTTKVPVTHFNHTMTPDLWLNFFCHPLYDHSHQKTYPMAVTHCKYGEDYRAMIDTKFNLTDAKSCMLWRLGAIIMRQNKTFEYVEDRGLRKTLLTIFGGLSPHRQTSKAEFTRGTFVTNLLQNSEHCKEILNDVANVKKLSSEKWTPFYNCINEAWVVCYVYVDIYLYNYMTLGKQHQIVIRHFISRFIVVS